MTIGTGIAIAGVWVFAAAIGCSRNTTTAAYYISTGVALMVTVLLA